MGIYCVAHRVVNACGGLAKNGLPWPCATKWFLALAECDDGLETELFDDVGHAR